MLFNDIVNEFLNTVKSAFVFIVITIIIIIIIVVFQKIGEVSRDKEQRRQEDEREEAKNIIRRENELKGQERMNLYWQNLSLVYGDKDHATLVKVLELLEEFNRYPDVSDDDYTLQIMHNRSECREEIKKILDYPKWVIREDDVSESPVWLELDIKYVKILLQSN